MAQNGWYIEKIITDLQTGKVDEFVKKEGKWFNYIKGEETTFTNAFNNNGTADGNLDAQEFTVQGIGTIIADATTVGGTTPSLPVNVTINVQPGSGITANWVSTNVQLQNITLLPSTATFVITPNPNYAVAASTFNSLSLSSFQLSTSMVSSVNFSDTGTPGTASNTVVGTITFDTSFSLTPGVTYTDTINLDEAGGVAFTIWSGAFDIYGLFQNANGTQDTFVNGVTYSSPNFTMVSNVQQNISGSMNVLNGASSLIFDALFELGPNTYFDQPAVINFNVPNSELGQYQYTTTDIGQTTRQVRIFYTADGTQSADDFNNISINIGTAQADLNFVPASVSLPSTAGTFDIAVNSDYTNWIVDEGTPGASWITNLFMLDQNTARISFLANLSGVDRDHTINLFSPSNNTSTPNDTLLIQQPLLATSTVTVYGSPQYYNYVSGNMEFATPSTNNLGFTSFNGTGLNEDGLHIDSTGGTVSVTAESAFGSFYGGYNDYNVQADPGVVTSTTAFGLVTPDMFLIQLSIAPNTTTSTKDIVITFTHPTDPAVSGSITLTQEAGYNSSVNTLQIFKSNATSDTTGVYDDISATFELDNIGGSIDVYAKIPDTDLTSDNYFKFINNIPQLPWIHRDNFNTNATLGTLDFTTTWNPTTNSFDFVFNGWIWSTVDYTLDPWVSATRQQFTPSVGNNVNVLVTLDYEANTEFVELDNGENFPTSRDVTIRMQNPENTQQSTADDSFVLKQSASPYCAWKQNWSFSGSNLGILESYSTLDYNLPVLTTHSTPTVGCYSVQDPITGNFNIGSASWLTVGSPTASSINAGTQYDVNVILEPNFTGSARSAKLAAYNSTTNAANHFTYAGNPTVLGNEADELTIIQYSTTPALYTSVSATNYSTAYWSTFIDASIITSNTSFLSYTHQLYPSAVNNTTGNVFKYHNNGASDAILDAPGFVVSSEFLVNYSSIGSSVPSWFNGGNHLTLAPNSSLESLTFDFQGSTTDTRIARLYYKHSNAEKYVRIEFIINPIQSI